MSFVLALVLVLGLTACGGNDTASTDSTNASSVEEYTPVDMTVACMTGPTGIGMAKLMADSEAKATANNYTFTVASAATEINAKFIKGEINIASVPTNVAATLYNKTNGKVRMLAVNTYGVLSILEKGDSIKSIADLKGKTIYSTGKGQNPEFIFKHILKENGLDPVGFFADAVCGHAVAAAQIAFVCHRDAQIGNITAQFINHRKPR